ncbi:MAG: hypothetical protein ABL887_09375 [Nitrosomonas sp.]
MKYFPQMRPVMILVMYGYECREIGGSPCRHEPYEGMKMYAGLSAVSGTGWDVFFTVNLLERRGDLHAGVRSRTKKAGVCCIDRM